MRLTHKLGGIGYAAGIQYFGQKGEYVGAVVMPSKDCRLQALRELRELAKTPMPEYAKHAVPKVLPRKYLCDSTGKRVYYVNLNPETEEFVGGRCE